MRTKVVIDDALLAGGHEVKREAVEPGLHTLIRLKRQKAFRTFRGKLDWQGDLEVMRAEH